MCGGVGCGQGNGGGDIEGDEYSGGGGFLGGVRTGEKSDGRRREEGGCPSPEFKISSEK